MQRVTAFFHRLVEIIQPIAEQFGGPGLLAIALADSSFLSLPEACDILIVVLSTRDPALWWYYAAMATTGSVAGCYVLYSLGRKGGEAFLRKKVRAHHFEWGMALFRRHGMFAIVVPSLLPPPMPFKLFVLVAGVADVKPLTFVAAVALGRGFRFGTIGWLAYRYGAEALTFIRANLPTVSLFVALAFGLFALALMFWQRRTRLS
jgi:membrane protein YqaA with SNARE-associated domain